WKFLRGTNEASTPVSAWRGLAFDDSTWQNLSAPFHYGTNSVGGDDTLTNGTILSDMRSNYTCIFLRQTFVVTQANSVTLIRVRPYLDDGCMIWLNGVEIRRFFMPAGNITYTNIATTARESFTSIIDMPGVQTNLVSGTNVFAVQAFNFFATNDDFRVDPEFFGVFVSPPTVTNLLPAAGTTVTNFSQLR